MTAVVVDTNILFSALLQQRARFTEILLTTEHRFIVNELVITELFRHKERIVRLSRLDEEEIVCLFHELIARIELFKEALVSPDHRHRAHELCHDIDPTDAPHVAITLETGALLWTGDEKLKRGLLAKGFERFFEPSSVP